jgi:hypothetical protein
MHYRVDIAHAAHRRRGLFFPQMRGINLAAVCIVECHLFTPQLIGQHD